MQNIGSAKESIDLVSSDIKVMSDRAVNVASTSEKTAEAEKTGSALMEEAVVKMNSIEKSVLASAEVVEKLGENSKQIGQIVDDIAGISGINSAVQTVSKGAENIVQITASIEESSHATNERTRTISSSTETQSASNEEIAAASSALANLAQDMNNVISQFKF